MAFFRKIMVFVILVAFTVTGALPSYAQGVFILPASGQMVGLSDAFTPVLLKGVTIDPREPLLFDFIVDNGQSTLEGQALTDETTKLVKYFLAGLAVPEKDLWVNLSPVESNRIMAKDLSHTDVGGDMLAQDYLLKQVTSTLMYPEKDLGKAFWAEVYKRTYDKFGHTDVPMDTFNKVWITPDAATVYQNGNNAFVAEAHLKVMLEADYYAQKKESQSIKDTDVTAMARDVVREVILPVLEKEVNEGRNFASLRQIFHSMILAGWYKNALKESLLNQVYSNTNKVQGIDIADKDLREKVYAQYLEAYRKGVYNYIKEDVDAYSGEAVERKYFSGGLNFDSAMKPEVVKDKGRAGLVRRFIGRASRIVYVMRGIFQENPSSGGKDIGIAKVETYTSFGQVFAIVHLKSSLHSASVRGRSFILQGANFSLDVTDAIVKEMNIFQGKAVTFEFWVRSGWNMDPQQMELKVHDAAQASIRVVESPVIYVAGGRDKFSSGYISKTLKSFLDSLKKIREGKVFHKSFLQGSALGDIFLRRVFEEHPDFISLDGDTWFIYNVDGLEDWFKQVNDAFARAVVGGGKAGGVIEVKNERMVVIGERNYSVTPEAALKQLREFNENMHNGASIIQARSKLAIVIMYLARKENPGLLEQVPSGWKVKNGRLFTDWLAGKIGIIEAGVTDKAQVFAEGIDAGAAEDGIADRKEANRLAMVFATGNPRTDADILAGYTRLRGKVSAVEERLIFSPLEDGIMYAIEKEYGPGGSLEAPIFKNVGRDEWEILDKTAFLQLLNNKIQQVDKSQDNKLVQGGIDLGQGDYLKIISTDTAGMPAFDPVRLMQFQKDLRGLVPVPMGMPQPVNLESLI